MVPIHQVAQLPIVQKKKNIHLHLLAGQTYKTEWIKF